MTETSRAPGLGAVCMHAALVGLAIVPTATLAGYSLQVLLGATALAAGAVIFGGPRTSRLSLAPVAVIVLWALATLLTVAAGASGSATSTVVRAGVALVRAVAGATFARTVASTTWLLLIGVCALTATVSAGARKFNFAYEQKALLVEIINPNVIAALTGVPILVLAAQLLRGKPDRAVAVGGVAGLLAFLATGSRGVLLSLALGICVVAVLTFRGPLRVAAGLGVTGVMTVFWMLLTNRIPGDVLRGRNQIWEVAMHLIDRSWPIGIGYPDSKSALWGYLRVEDRPYQLAGGAHNWYIQEVLANGLAGLVVLVLAVALMSRALLTRRAEPVTVGLAAWLGAFQLSRGLFESDGLALFGSVSLLSALTWLLIGALYARVPSTGDSASSAGPDDSSTGDQVRRSGGRGDRASRNASVEAS